ncbi:MAG: hypothetical protein ABFC67_06615 [Mizugakiibacter sp.]|uniref:hypothetical protein n=1 Tax=Mizugakiibacter sp. TaxID=1972610 RepID=UPI0031BC5E01|nr:hypothetical protein [Xanthomonadaceae bacterium]
MQARDLGYLAVFVLVLLPPAAAGLADAGLAPGLAAWLPMVVVFGLVPLADALIGQDRHNPSPAEAHAREEARVFRWLTWLCVPAWLALQAWCAARYAAWPPGRRDGSAGCCRAACSAASSRSTWRTS